MSKMMLGVYLPGDSTAVLKEVPIPKPGIGEVLLKVKASGICGSDIHFIYHEHKGRKGKGTAYWNVIAGHEPCGEIVELGQGCRFFKEGDRVVVYHVSGCGFCRNCRRGFQVSCSEPTRKGYGWRRDGGHANYLLADEKDLVKLPKELSWKDGSFVACGVGTAYEATLRANISGVDCVLVVGLGPLGSAVSLLSKGRGAKLVIGVDTQPQRVESAKNQGLVDLGLVVGDETLEQIDEVTKGGASCTIDCSGNPHGRLLALQACREWGRTVYVGETGHVQFDVSDELLHKHRTIIGSWVTSLANMEDCCDNLVAWNLHPEAIVQDVFPLEKAPEAYQMMAEGSCGKIVIDPEL